MERLVNRLVCCALTLSLAPTAAHAQPHHSHVADAKREYAAIFSHPDNPCSMEQTTAGYDDCIGKELAFTEAHLAALLTAVRGIASDDAPASPAESAMLAGNTELALINNADAAWREYRGNVCRLMEAGMAGGSGAGATGDECEYRMDRQYAQQLTDAVYLKILAD